MRPLFINLILLGGTTEEKIIASHKAGFDQVELWQQNLTTENLTPDEVKNILHDQKISLTDYQVLLDFDGAPELIRNEKYLQAQQMLAEAAQLGADTLLVPASTDFGCRAEYIVDDLHWLAKEAEQYKIRIAYEAMSWSTVNYLLPSAWQVVQKVDQDNFGLVVDAFHIFARQRTLADLEGIPMDKIFLVQLSDLNVKPSPGNIVDIARHHRLLPGQGAFPLPQLMDKLHNYHGPLGLEVFNDDIRALPPTQAARMAMQSLLSLI